MIAFLWLRNGVCGHPIEREISLHLIAQMIHSVK